METTTPIAKSDLNRIIHRCENDAPLTTREKLQIAEALRITLSQMEDIEDAEDGFDNVLRINLDEALSTENLELIKKCFGDILKAKNITHNSYSKETINKIISKIINIFGMKSVENEDSKILQKKLIFLCYFMDLRSLYTDFASRGETNRGPYCFKNEKILAGTRLGKLGNFNIENGNIVFNNGTFEENINKAKETFKSQID